MASRLGSSSASIHLRPSILTLPPTRVSVPPAAYGYLVDGRDGHLPNALVALFDHGCTVRLSSKAFVIGGREYARGSLLVRGHENADGLQARTKLLPHYALNSDEVYIAQPPARQPLAPRRALAGCGGTRAGVCVDCVTWLFSPPGPISAASMHGNPTQPRARATKTPHTAAHPAPPFCPESSGSVWPFVGGERQPVRLPVQL